MRVREFRIDLDRVLELDIGLAILPLIEVGDALVEKLLFFDFRIERTLGFRTPIISRLDSLRSIHTTGPADHKQSSLRPIFNLCIRVIGRIQLKKRSLPCPYLCQQK